MDSVARPGEEDAFFDECDAMADLLEADGSLALDDDMLATASGEAEETEGTPRDQARDAALDAMRRNIRESCEAFADTFLSHGSSVSELHVNLMACDNTLRDIQTALRKYLRRIESVSRDIGVLQTKASATAIALTNTLNVQGAVAAAVEGLFVPPDCMKMILMAEEHELGQQFMHEITRFGMVLAARRRGTASVTTSDGASSIVDLRTLPAYAESGEVCRKLAGVACAKIRGFLLHKIDSTLGKTRTNVAVQQQHVLREFRPLVHFVRQAEAAFDDPVMNPATVFYREVRGHYCALLSGIYAANLKAYICQCNQLEIDWYSASAAGAARAAQSSHGFPSFASGLFGGTKHTAAVQPTLTDKSAGISGQDFSLGARGHILETVSGTPIIPVVARKARSQHSYEETFRSVLVLLCDVVTSEFLFSVDFFGGDTSVYVDVFRPTIQLVVDYVAEVVLRDSSASTSRAGSAPDAEQRSVFDKLHSASSINTDYCGLLVLIRLVHVFRVKMHSRRIYCLDGFFDSLLMLIWPSFKVAFDKQLASIRNCTTALSVQMLSLYRSDIERLVAVHPITERYACMSLSLMLLSRGIDLSDVETHVPTGTLQDLLGPSGHGDTTESAHRFAVLESNLSHLRIEFQRVIESTGEALVNAVARDPSLPVTVAQHVFVVNNLFHVLSVWSGMSDAKEEGDGGSEPGSPARAGHDSDDAASTASSASMVPSSLGIPAFRLAKQLVHASSDFKEIKRIYSAAASKLATEALRVGFGGFLNFVERDSDNGDVGMDRVQQEGKAFATSLRPGLDAVVACIRRAIADTGNASEVIKLAFTQLVVANTSFHGLATSVAGSGGHAALRQFVITSQQLLHQMKRATGA